MTAATSLRRRALLWMIAPPILVGAIAFAAAYAFDLHDANRLFDAQLQELAFYVGADPETDPPPFAHDIALTFVLRVWSPDGVLLRATPGAVELPLPVRLGFATVEVKGERWRVYLIDNAVRYTPSGGAIDVGLRLDGDRFVFDVIDSGCGVADADIPRLFDRFFRAAPADAEGSGLGLSIAQAVAERHGLSIALQNRPDAQGFWVRVAAAANDGGLIRS